jgi:hypothetical protein
MFSCNFQSDFSLLLDSLHMFNSSRLNTVFTFTLPHFNIPDINCHFLSYCITERDKKEHNNNNILNILHTEWCILIFADNGNTKQLHTGDIFS